MKVHLSFFLFFLVAACTQESNSSMQAQPTSLHSDSIAETPPSYDTTLRTIHIFVALCDNQYQGIVPVPKAIGNGQDPHNNLYWGCGYGIRTFFKRSEEWVWIKTYQPDTLRLKRAIFKHTKFNYYVVADAYDGKYIKKCTQDFMAASCGMEKDTLQLNDSLTLGISGNSKLLPYIGHDSLMEFELEKKYKNKDGVQRDVIILACISRTFFSPYLKEANVNPLVWTTGLMAPEAYTIHDALSGYVLEEPNEAIRTRAAKSYASYHKKCSEKAARNLLVTGW